MIGGDRLGPRAGRQRRRATCSRAGSTRPRSSIGVLAVATSAYLAAVYLAADAARRDERELERAFRARALGAGVVAGALALAGLVVAARTTRTALYDELVCAATRLPAVIVSALAGLGDARARRTAAASSRRATAPRSRSPRSSPAGRSRQWPTHPAGPDVRSRPPRRTTRSSPSSSPCSAAARSLFPSLALLFRLTLAGRFDHGRAGRRPPLAAPRAAGRARAPALLVRASPVACLIVGFGLLTVADAGWAHAVGVTALFAFMVAGFLALAPADQS